jgi:hypothetical protein
VGATSSSITMSAVTKARRSPIATACAISGCARSRFSIWAGEMFLPPDVMMSSFLRSVMVRKPSSSSAPTSPVASQPSSSVIFSIEPSARR